MKPIVRLFVKGAIITHCLASRLQRDSKWFKASYRQAAVGLPVEQPVYMNIRRAGILDDDEYQVLYEGFSFCPYDFSRTGITLECVSSMSIGADLYVNNTFVRRDSSSPFTITGRSEDGSFLPWVVPDGPVTLTCYTERWYTWVNGIFDCSSEETEFNDSTSETSTSTSPVPSVSPNFFPSSTVSGTEFVASSSPSMTSTPKETQSNIQLEISSLSTDAPSGSPVTLASTSPSATETPSPSYEVSASPSISTSNKVLVSPDPSPSRSSLPSTSASIGPDLQISISSSPTSQLYETPTGSPSVSSIHTDVISNTPLVSSSSKPSESSSSSNASPSDIQGESFSIEIETSTSPSSESTDMIENPGEINLPDQNSSNFQVDNENSRIFSVGSGSFRMVFPASHVLPTRRISACVAVAKGKVYLIGGQYGKHHVAEFDPVTSSWTKKPTEPPHEFHHHTCLPYESDNGWRIFVIGAFYGSHPTETPHENTWIYNVDSDSWSSIAGLPEWRRRGAGAAAIEDSRIYFAAGSTGNHGSNTELRPYLDVLDVENIEAGWIAKGNIPDRRDHTKGGVANGYFCVAGGRVGSEPEYLEFQVAPINCFNIQAETWERRINLPIPRSDPAVTGTCNGLVLIAGGEDKDTTINTVDLYDPTKDEFLESISLVRSRFGAAAASADCSCGNVYVMAGAAWKGTKALLNDVEVWSSDGVRRNC